MGLSKDIKDMLKWMGIVFFSGTAGAGGMLLTMDLIGKHYSDMGNGLPLLVEGVHLKEGNHNGKIKKRFLHGARHTAS